MRIIENLKFKIENFGISFLLVIASLCKGKKMPEDLKKMEFSTSAQRMGVCFTDKIRDIFRGRWVKRS